MEYIDCDTDIGQRSAYARGRTHARAHTCVLLRARFNLSDRRTNRWLTCAIDNARKHLITFQTCLIMCTLILKRNLQGTCKSDKCAKKMDIQKGAPVIMSCSCVSKEIVRASASRNVHANGTMFVCWRARVHWIRCWPSSTSILPRARGENHTNRVYYI
jgi:hypothetical protein